MEVNIYDILLSDKVLVIFTVISMGYLLGKLNIFGFRLGNVTGVLIIGLLFGSFGFVGVPELATFGFTIFIFCVGLQAGPSFFAAFASDGTKYLAISFIVAISAVTLCQLFSVVFDMELGLAAGMLAGSLTSTPTLVGAQDAVRGGLVPMPNDISAEQVIKNISVAYSLTYLFGIGGLMFIIKFIPTIFSIDLPAESRKIMPTRANIKPINENNLPMVRTYQIDSGKLVGKNIAQIQEETKQYFTVLGIRRDQKIIDLDVNITIQKNDIISVVASIAQHNLAKNNKMPEVFDKELLNYRIRTKEIVIAKSDCAGMSIQELHLESEHACFPLGLVRMGIRLPISKNTIIQKGDKLEVIGEEEHIIKLSETLGTLETDLERTDLLTLCLGVALGLLLGTIVINLGEISIGLGSAGGLLIVGILVGFFRSVHPTFGAFPRAARNIMMDFGIVLFMSSIGLNAGSEVLGALSSVGFMLILCGMSITIIPVLVAFLFGRYVLRMNAALLLGSITGSMTSTPSLNLVNEAANSQVPGLGYAGSYAFSNVILTFCGALMVFL
tara:strand:- start:1959 stop:3623 length:1665 start_codon:yes stop_codon:yes gene_type:complete